MTLEELRELDLENLGQWPFGVKLALALVLALVILGLGGYLLVVEDLARLSSEQRREQQLKQSFRDKYQFSAHLERHQQQLLQAQVALEQMLSMLPRRDEMPGLLDDVTYLATRTDLSIESIGWLPEQQGELYVELPLKIRLKGGYPQFGRFAASLASLPRIVNLRDLTIERGDGELAIEVVALTYRLAQPPQGQP